MPDPISELGKDDDKPREFYRELRCDSCRLLICFEYIFDGYIRFTCPRCKEVNNFHFKHRKGARNSANNVE